MAERFIITHKGKQYSTGGLGICSFGKDLSNKERCNELVRTKHEEEQRCVSIKWDRVITKYRGYKLLLIRIRYVWISPIKQDPM